MGPGVLGRTLRFARMAGTSIAAADAAPWVTDFLNAAYFARPPEERDVDDLRLAFAILTTRWDRADRGRLHLTDLPAFNRAFGRARLRRRGGIGRLGREALLNGADRLLGDWFSSAYADPARRGWGIVFESTQRREAHLPEKRLRWARLGPLTPPVGPAGRLVWGSYEPVPTEDPQLVLARLAAPESWPDFGSDHGRFTPLRSGGLLGQTFEIEVVAGAGTRHPLLTRGYVTATRLALPDQPEALAGLVTELDEGVATPGERALPKGHEPLAVVELTSHAGHFLGAARSHIVLSAGPDGAALRDIGVWEPLDFPQRLAYRLGGRAAQHAFWGEGDPANSMLHQFAAPGVR